MAKKRNRMSAGDFMDQNFLPLKKSSVQTERTNAVELYFPTTENEEAGVCVWVPRSVWLSRDGVNYLRRWFVNQKRLANYLA